MPEDVNNLDKTFTLGKHLLNVLYKSNVWARGEKKVSIRDTNGTPGE